MRTYWKRRYRRKRKKSGGLGHTETSGGCCDSQFFTNVDRRGLADRMGWCKGGGGAESGGGLLGVESVGVDAENHEN